MPENLGAGEGGREGGGGLLGGSQFQGEVRGLDDNAAPLAPPFQYSLAPVKRA